MQILLDRRLVLAGDWPQTPDMDFVPWRDGLDLQLQRMRDRYTSLPTDRPLLYFDVAAFDGALAGEGVDSADAHELTKASEDLELEWLMFDRLYAAGDAAGRDEN
ncbi:MAG: hypothetical protein ABR498_05470 [Candidatus Dormibacteria bacterium]